MLAASFVCNLELIWVKILKVLILSGRLGRGNGIETAKCDGYNALNQEKPLPRSPSPSAFHGSNIVAILRGV